MRAIATITAVGLLGATAIAGGAAASAAPTPIRVVAQSAAVTDKAGSVWSADQYFTGGSLALTTQPITGTSEPRLYQGERWGMTAYRLPVGGTGQYHVRLLLAEIYFDSPGQRVFDVTAEGSLKAANVDILAKVGKFHAYDLDFDASVTDGALDLGFTNKADVAKVAAIEVTPVSTSPTPTPTPTPTPPPAGASVARINTGGPAYTDSTGKQWSADSGSIGGSVAVRTSTVIGTSDPVLYRDERWGMTGYEIKVPSAGTYHVALSESETYYTAGGRRVFSVTAEGQSEIRDLDIFAAAGGANKALVPGFDVAVTDGVLNLGFTASTDAAKVDAISVSRTGTTTPTPTPTSTPTPTPTPGGSAGVLSGLPWNSGIQTNSTDDAVNWGNYRGRPCDVALGYTWRQSWSEWDDPGAGGFWSQWDGWSGTVVVAHPLFPQDGTSTIDGYNALASGAYDQHWVNFGRNMVAAGRANSPVRLGWEADGDWYVWGIRGKGVSDDLFKQAFRHAALALRQGNPQVKIDLTLEAQALGAMWPGDDVVDIVGQDYYDMWQHLGDFTTMANKPEGINSAVAFARAHGKKLGVGEWGVVSQSPYGGGDSPAFVQGMWNTFSANRDILAYEMYFSDSGEGNVKSSLSNPNQNPGASSRYQQLW
jgi:Malectin domain/Glycosyl hydrolase family 26